MEQVRTEKEPNANEDVRVPTDLGEELAMVAKGQMKMMDAVGVDDLFLESVEQKAYSLYASGRYLAAETLLDGLIALDEERAYPHLLVGDIALRTDRLDIALTHLARAYELDGENPIITLKLGEALLRNDQREDARKILELTTSLADDGEDDPHTRRASVLLRQHFSDSSA